MYTHIPVLLDEVLNLLEPQAGQNFVDATLGGGGYTEALLEATSPNGKVLSIDLDEIALKNAAKNLAKYKQRSVLVHGNFREIASHIRTHKFENISGIVADIGLSSYQLDESGRGISFQKHELLDMRFDASSKDPDARFILNQHSTAELAKIFTENGEEKYSHKIADHIVRARTEQPIKYTTDLNELIKSALPKPVQYKWQDSARRIYQALRIEVNHELVNLERFLPDAFNLLAPGGRLVVVTFHSLEDRIVKNYFKSLAKGCVCPLEFPICKCGQTPQGKILTKKAVVASESEQEINSRSKSAKLRAVQKI
ncbi:MAG TPA: 16S rRNA (cytosine(1402)-N(4))-methyltransferase RsmH [Candidatus Doudnabacteria bacterium]|nr:16S rRNA (cytosine(1402)-N(4))-methyltransferase RsmH [Candidatus Doudnabacteria bacterium]